MSQSRFHIWVSKTAPNMAVRLVITFIGMACVAFGIALSRQTLLGSSPVSAIPTVLSFAFPISLGMATWWINLLFIALQVVLLRREFNLVQILQVPYLLLFSAAIDLFVQLVKLFSFDNYFLCMFWILVSSVFVALGVYLQAQMRIILTPGDAVVDAIAHVSHWRFSSCKLGFDIVQITLGALISLATMGGLYGVREGTLVSALLIGPLIRVITRLVGDIQRFVPIDGYRSFIPEAK